MPAATWVSVPCAGAVGTGVLWLNRIKSTDTVVLPGVSWRASGLQMLVGGLPMAARALMVGGEIVGTSM